MFIYAITPIVGMSFPALTPIILAAAGAMGYKMLVDMKEGGDLNEALRQQIHETTTVQLRIDDLIFDSMEQEVRRAESLYLRKEDITLAIIKDERGKLRIEVNAPQGADPAVLQQEGREFAEEVAQLFAYHRAVQEMEAMNAEVVEEVKGEEEEIVLRVRRWT